MKIGIVGLGLIGGSLGLDFRSKSHLVYGLSRSQNHCEIAQYKGIVDVADTQASVLSEVEVVFLCPPIGSIHSVFQTIKSSLSRRTIVTDVGSVKGAIAQQLHGQWPYFIGGHPMAGTSDSGIEAAQSHLFQNRPYVLTPFEDTAPHAVETLKSLIQDLGANLYLASPTDHDRAVSLISHLPIMVSSALIASCLDSQNISVKQLAQALASSGFCDTSRVGGGNPELGRMIAQFNQAELLRSLDIYAQTLQTLRAFVAREDWDNLEAHLTKTQQARPNFLNR